MLSINYSCESHDWLAAWQKKTSDNNQWRDPWRWTSGKHLQFLFIITVILIGDYRFRDVVLRVRLVRSFPHSFLFGVLCARLTAMQATAKSFKTGTKSAPPSGDGWHFSLQVEILFLFLQRTAWVTNSEGEMITLSILIAISLTVGTTTLAYYQLRQKYSTASWRTTLFKSLLPSMVVWLR